MGTISINAVNDRLLYLDYSKPEIVKQLISNWSTLDSLTYRGDTVAISIVADMERALGVSLSEIIAYKKTGLSWDKDKTILTEPQFISIVYCLGMGYTRREIAFVLGCNRQAVDIHINKGVKRICKYLEGRWYEQKIEKKGRG